MKTTLTLIGAAAALGLAGAAVAQTDNSMMGNSMMNNSSMKSGKKMHHSKHMKTSSTMATGTDTNGMRGADSGSAMGATPNGGMSTPTTPSNGMSPQ